MDLSCCANRRPSNGVAIPKDFPALDMPSVQSLMTEDMRCMALAAFGTSRELQALLDGLPDSKKKKTANAADPFSGTTPLIAACRRDHIAGVEILLACGADPGKANQIGWTPLMAATKHAGSQVLDALHLALGTSMEEKT